MVLIGRRKPDCKAILNLLLNAQLPVTQVAAATGSTRTTVRRVRDAALRERLEWDNIRDMTNDALYWRLFPEKSQTRQNRAEPDFESVHARLGTKGNNLKFFWELYCSEAESAGKVPYQYSQFHKLYCEWCGKNDATLRLQHRPGEAAQVDWSGLTAWLTDPAAGKRRKAHFAVITLPFSGMVYTEAFPDEKSRSFILANVHAFEYFGGSPELLVPDNLKTGVDSHTGYDVVLNRAYDDMAEYYGCAVAPTRVRKPRDKGGVERGVSIVEQKIIAPLAMQTFYSLEDLNAAVRPLLEEINSMPFAENRTRSRREILEQEERDALQPLPPQPYEVPVWLKRKVPRDYLVSDGVNRYSVPYKLIGETVAVRVTSDEVVVFHDGGCVARHRRAAVFTRDPIYRAEHMPPNHRAMLSYDLESLKIWMEGQEDEIRALAQSILSAGRSPRQYSSKCASFRRLVESRSPERILHAIEYIRSCGGTPTLATVRQVVRGNLDQFTRPDPNPADGNSGFLRGSGYYRED